MSYTGGKNGSGVYQRIISQIPPHRVYVEPFCGAAAVLRRKRPAARSVAIDACPGAIDGLVGVRACVPNLELIVGDGIEYLRHLVPPPHGAVAAGTDAGGGRISGSARDGSGGAAVGTDTGVGCARADVFVYADPPYVRSSRRDPGRDYYAHEWTDATHRLFLDVATGLACPVAISGYWSNLYAEALAGWRSISFETTTRGGGAATEWVWMNYPAPTALHDYRYLGDTYDERWRIHKRQRSWVRLLAQMPELERRAMLAALTDAYGDAVRSYLDGDAVPRAANTAGHGSARGTSPAAVQDPGTTAEACPAGSQKSPPTA